MATGASTADLAVVLVDARQGRADARRGGTPSSSRCSASASSSLAVNKMDLVDFDQARFDAIADGLSRLSPRTLGFETIDLHPGVGAARRQCHLTSRAAMPWYRGPTLLEHLETVDGRRERAASSRSASRCNGSTGRISISAAMPARSSAARSSRATRSSSSRPGKRVAGRAHRHRRRRSRARASRAGGDARRSPTRSTSAAATSSAAPQAAPAVADQFAAHICVDRRGADAARPLLRHQDAARQTGHGHHPELEIQAQRRHSRARRGARRSS